MTYRIVPNHEVQVGDEVLLVEANGNLGTWYNVETRTGDTVRVLADTGEVRELAIKNLDVVERWIA